MKNARTAAYTALLQVDVNAGYSNIVIDKAIKEADLDQRDASLAAAIFYGVLERRITLDYIINQFSRIPVKQMTPDILEILRMACYQILYMEKIPHSAAVNEAVNMAKQTKGGKSPGFVNGVLRGLLRGKEQIQMPNEEKGTFACFKYHVFLSPVAHTIVARGLRKRTYTGNFKKFF